MRKTLLFVLCAALGLPAAAQSWDQAFQLSRNEYGGTARSIAMGNALTAVGGDPGSLVLNPAGSAVAGYSQFFLTPALSISSTHSSGYVEEGAQAPVGLADHVSSGFTRVKMPSLGFVLNIDSGRRHGLKRMSVGFVLNSTNDFTLRTNAAGVNYGKYSYAGSLASLADGYAKNVMANGDWFAVGTGQEPQWNSVVGFRTGMFDDVGGRYLAVTDLFTAGGQREAAAPLYQRYGQQTKGFKQDILLNVGANFSDVFYLGANLGITTLSYGEVQSWEEMPESPDTFPLIKYDDGTQAQFQSLLMRRMYSVKGTGVYFKAGFLWRPFAGLRLGGAIQTPSILNLTGRCQWYGETQLRGKSYPSRQSPEDEWLYSLVSPFRFNVGAAYAFGSFAVLSADYEWVNFGLARFGGRSEYSDMFTEGPYKEQNADIRDVLGVSHHVRAGLEFKPTQSLAVRVGYNLSTSPQVSQLEYSFEKGGGIAVTVVPLTEQERREQLRQSVSFGAGYALGSFFWDLAVRLRFLPTEYLIPYAHYKYTTNYEVKLADLTMETPVIRTTGTGIDAVLTVGWRF